jgi:alanine racemase
MAVVKADGYGHGATEAARKALAAGADSLAVATIDEGAALRAAGIAAPVLLLSEPPPGAAADAVAEGLTPTVFTRESALDLSEAARRAERVVGFHLKVDTGMNRIGVAADDAVHFLLSLRGLPGLTLDGTFTHFATADVPGDWDLERQVVRFEEALENMKAAGFDPGVVHAANSAATVLAPRTHYDMVRCGIAVYGLHPSDSTKGRVELEPAMSVKAKVSQVKRVPMGEGVSYGLTWRASKPATVATLPLGYGDGVHRVLSNDMRVLLGGRECAQIGTICMDALMVEVPDGLDVSIGDEAAIVGIQGSAELTLDELATRAGTINYELACAFGMRLPRVHV